ncbi:MAG TPA: hypothetical protein ENH85_01985 [Candidatus Scalindua sp.]|nr:hypothetical protein [Candidatus Scalindua sp.]
MERSKPKTTPEIEEKLTGIEFVISKYPPEKTYVEKGYRDALRWVLGKVALTTPEIWKKAE